jgi:sortase A
MSDRTRRRLHILAYAGLALAVLLACVPMGMRAYGQWTQARARRHAAATLGWARGHVRPAKHLRKPIPAPPRRRFEMSMLQIPAINVEDVIEEGTGNWNRVMGPGHEPGTPGAGGAGNCIIAAHRNMWGATFADLHRLRPGDEVVVTDARGVYTYQVDVSREVSTRERALLGQTRDARVTLYTCTEPFDQNRRWLVQARLVDRYMVK